MFSIIYGYINANDVNFKFCLFSIWIVLKGHNYAAENDSQNQGQPKQTLTPDGSISNSTKLSYHSNSWHPDIWLEKCFLFANEM